MAATTYLYNRGDAIALALQCSSGDAACVNSLKAQIRQSVTLGPNISGQIDLSATASISFVPASSPNPAYWVILIAPADSYYLSAGQYELDAELSVAGLPITTQSAMVTITEPATKPTPPTNSGYGAPWINPTPDTPSAVLTLQWVDALDNSALVYPAINLTLDPNVIALMETIMTPQAWPIGTTLNFLNATTVKVQIDALSGFDSISFNASLTDVGAPYPQPVTDEAGHEYQQITSPGLYSIPAHAWLTPVHTGSASTPAITYFAFNY